MGVWWINDYVFAMRLQFIICLFNATSNVHLISFRERWKQKDKKADESPETVQILLRVLGISLFHPPSHACTQRWALHYRFHISFCLFSWFIDRRGFLIWSRVNDFLSTSLLGINGVNDLFALSFLSSFLFIYISLSFSV